MGMRGEDKMEKWRKGIEWSNVAGDLDTPPPNKGF